jgi:hypothetical protein
VFQDSYCDLIHDAATLVSFLSQGALSQDQTIDIILPLPLLCRLSRSVVYQRTDSRRAY